ncbi:RDD family protein [Candidatus Albibeggiatoa sp. nov. BB20]|uniref:RDD family protein n=1 Tax=Candidatus Albibeggiatoa sp. nov. BB20 TaxID=3162723 RepID=UPI00336531D9
MTQDNQYQEKTFLPLGLWRYYTMVLYESLLLFAVLFFAGILVLPLSHAENSPIYALYLGIVSFVYFAWQWRRSGQTLAMSTWKVRLIQDDRDAGTKISWWQAVRRFVVASVVYLSFILACYWSFSSEPIMWLASVLWLIFFLNTVSPWFDMQRRMWQDLASGTRLVREV